MSYNPDVHHRKSIRFKNYDYSKVGLYFITICTQNKEKIFGEITNVGAHCMCPKYEISLQCMCSNKSNTKMILSEYGKIVEEELNKTNKIRQNIERKQVAKPVITNDSDKADKKQPKKVEKVGRNELCPCGSGKKYKQCCGK